MDWGKRSYKPGAQGLNPALPRPTSNLGAQVKTGWRSSSHIGLAVLLAMGLAWGSNAQAQVGLASREARVTLVASAPPRAAMTTVGAPRLIAVHGSVREAAVTVGLSSNHGYRLVVRGTGRPQAAGSEPSPRIWVRGVDGKFQELGIGSRITVVQGGRHGKSDPEIVYRIESSGAELEIRSLPVQYEIAVTPVL